MYDVGIIDTVFVQQDCRTSVKENYYDLNVVPAWYDLKVFGRGVVVIIIDDGLETTHPDLADNYVSTQVHIFNFIHKIFAVLM